MTDVATPDENEAKIVYDNLSRLKPTRRRRTEPAPWYRCRMTKGGNIINVHRRIGKNLLRQIKRAQSGRYPWDHRLR